MNEKYTRPQYVFMYLKAIFFWIAEAVLIGVCCGLVGALFYKGVGLATELREEQEWLLYLLPAAGLLIVMIYRLFRVEGMGTNDVIDAVHDGKPIRLLLLPAIFAATILTHLCGGSSGREGAALQIGGDIGNHVGRLTRLKDSDLGVATMVGMAAFFAAIFGTPLTATVFVVMFINVGNLHEMAVFPCFVSSMIAYLIAGEFGAQSFRFAVTVPEVSPAMLLRVLLLAALCGLVSTLECQVLHGTDRLYERFIKNPYLRVAAGAILVIGLTLLTGSRDYNGAGINVIRRALVDGEAEPAAFALKLLFTALTLGAGFKGGEIVPTFFIGAAFGCWMGPLIGLPAAFGAALGMTAVFGGVTNTLIAPMFLAVEAFGAGGIHFFALAAIISYICSGYNGLYSSQKILYSKVRARRLDMNANESRFIDPLDPLYAPRVIKKAFRRRAPGREKIVRAGEEGETESGTAENGPDLRGD